jgi:hypothetical protein
MRLFAGKQWISIELNSNNILIGGKIKTSINRDSSMGGLFI